MFKVHPRIRPRTKLQEIGKKQNAGPLEVEPVVIDDEKNHMKHKGKKDQPFFKFISLHEMYQSREQHIKLNDNDEEVEMRVVVARHELDKKLIHIQQRVAMGSILQKQIIKKRPYEIRNYNVQEPLPVKGCDPPHAMAGVVVVIKQDKPAQKKECRYGKLAGAVQDEVKKVLPRTLIGLYEWKRSYMDHDDGEYRKRTIKVKIFNPGLRLLAHQNTSNSIGKGSLNINFKPDVDCPLPHQRIMDNVQRLFLSSSGFPSRMAILISGMKSPSFDTLAQIYS
jgi:hypothetical protein